MTCQKRLGPDEAGWTIFPAEGRARERSRGSCYRHPDAILPCGPDKAHTPETRGDMLAMLGANPAVPAERRMEVARLMHDLTASDQAGWMSVISLHGGGSPTAMRREIYRYYPLQERRALIEKLQDRGVLDVGQTPSKQPGRCCPVGCQVPETPRLTGGPERGRLAAE